MEKKQTSAFRKINFLKDNYKQLWETETYKRLFCKNKIKSMFMVKHPLAKRIFGFDTSLTY